MDQRPPENSAFPIGFLIFPSGNCCFKPAEAIQLPILRMAPGLATMFGQTSGTQLNVFRNHILATCITQILRDENQPGAKETRIRGILQRFRTQEINAAKLSPWITVSYGNMPQLQQAYARQ